MRKISIIMALGLVLVFGLALQAGASEVTYTGTDTHYSITSVNSEEAHATVTENYNATQLVPSTALAGIGFTSHDGAAVIEGTALAPILFTKQVILDDQDISKNFEMTWIINNTSPYTWSDYHIILSDSGEFFTKTQSADFHNSTFTNLVADWDVAAPGSKLIAPGDVLHLNFSVDTSAMSPGSSFEMTQIATAAIPIPATLPLFGSGLLGLGLLGWRKIRS